jgi:hypothetical protein
VFFKFVRKIYCHFNSEQPFLQKNIKFSLKVGCVRYMHVKELSNLKFFIIFVYFLDFFLRGEGGRHERENKGRSFSLGW